MTRFELQLRLLNNDGETPTRAAISDLTIAGWTGRDPVLRQQHSDELARLGVKPPAVMPCFYRAAATLLTTAEEIQVLGPHTTGEVECVLLALPEGLHVGVGSDHTDRKVEAHDVALAKQLCAKPLAPELWPFEEVADHWDQLVLRSYSVQHGQRVLYQEGALRTLLAPQELIARCLGGAGTLAPGSALFGGTVPVKEAIESSELFEIELIDPVRDRELAHSYAIRVLPL